ncbi:uncharacterized protein LAESUDRAFT_667513 [Laetiporus sulphureus 93-53]|uniref:Uncharacterized protein n=1 Tax=Laetiporus sulphureus 93-53 TaxID=1314785 RepID=A0A165AX31_9APHY|nr:uncharacterized protein LAESUDRAFT_667513 [Laetiporus sulphureus 93-53]KZS99818.1 hypothetical protein LAESUDRAFT_667513 [Laetiporus sulphureus 93-53]
MHNLFLGLVQYHICTIIGMDMPNDDDYRDEFDAAEDPDKLKDDVQKQADKIRKLLQFDPTAKQLGRYTRHALRVVCREMGVESKSWRSTRKLKKKWLIDALLQSLRTLEFAHSPTSDSRSLLPGETIIGDELINECAHPNINHTSTHDDQPAIVFSLKDLDHLRDDITQMTRPTYSSGPPRNMGTKARRKLKVDHWKALIEFELPVSMMKRWNSSPALRCATSYTTSVEHRDKYTGHMHAYLSRLLWLHPGITLRRNHHNTMHLGDFLLRFRPIFPFERIIGILQQTTTNSKLGQMERTMLESFCAAANIKAFLKHAECPTVLQRCVSVVESCY